MSRASVAIGSYRGSRGRSLARMRRPAGRRRAVVTTVAIGGFSLLLLATGLWWLLTAPVFAVQRVESGPYRFSAKAEVDAALRVALGRNIWSLSAAEVGRAGDALPWVRDVHVSRRVPDTVVVELVEWRPLLGVAIDSAGGDEFMLVGDDRVLPMPAHLDPPALPLLIGARVVSDEAGDRRLDPADGALVDALLAALGETGFEASCPLDFVRLTPQSVILELARGAGRVRLGRGEFQDRLSRYLIARDRIPHGAEVDLRFADRITIQPAAGDRS